MYNLVSNWFHQNKKKTRFYDYVYLEDDVEVVSYLKEIAARHQLNLLVVNSISEFLEHLWCISKDQSKIFIKYHLKYNKLRGDFFARMLKEDGYQQLYLVNSHFPISITQYHRLKSPAKSSPAIRPPRGAYV